VPDHRPMEVARSSPSSLVPAPPQIPPAAGFPPAFGVDGAAPAINPVRQYVTLILHYWWMVILAAGIGAAYQYRNTAGDTPIFRTFSTIRLIDQRPATSGSIVPDYAAGLSGANDPVLTQVYVIQSRVVAERVVDQLGLELRSGTRGFYMDNIVNVHVSPSAPPSAELQLQFTRSGVMARHDRDAISADYGAPLTIAGVTFTVPREPAVNIATVRIVPRDAAVDEVIGGLDAKSRDMTSVIDIGFTGIDPYVVQQVASTVASVFKTLSAEQAKQQSQRRRIFVEGQLNTTDSLLRIAEARVSNYRRGTQAFSARERFAAEQQVQAELDRRSQTLENSKRTYVALLDALQHHTKGEPSPLRTMVFVPDPAGNAAVNDLYRELMRYETARDSLTSGTYARTAQHPDVQRIDAMIAVTEPKLVIAVQNQLSALDGNLAAIAAERARGAGEIATLPGDEETEQRLQRDADNIRKLSDKLNDDLQLARIAEAVEAGQVEIVDLAKFPGPAIGPSRRRKVAYGGLVGLLAGIGLALVVDRLNSSVRRWEDLNSVMHVPGLALIPQISSDAGIGWKSRTRAAATRYLPAIMPRPGVVHNDSGSELVMVNDVRSSTAESYRKLMTNLMFSASRPGLKIVVITSASAGEGKTTASANLAVAFAQQGRRVALMDADLRRPRIHKVFGLSLEPGLTDVLVGNATLEQGVRASGVAGLTILTAGTLPPNPLEFLGGERMSVLLATLRANYDVVLVDTPPVLVTADAGLMGMQADGVVMVVRAGKTERHAARHAVEQIVNLGGRLLGAVLNDPDARTSRYGRYADDYYGHGYAPQGH
jgi:capsular exopolysaccharide synthesis family protein